MRYLKSFNESLDHNSNNKAYIDMIDVLQYVFDDFNIIPLPEVDDIDDHLEYNTNQPNWGFGIKSDSERFTSDFNKAKDSIIQRIAIWNIKDDKKDELELSLFDNIDRIKSHTGKYVNFKYEEIANGLGDFVIEISDKEECLKSIFNNLKDNINYDKFPELSDDKKNEVIQLLFKIKKYF